MVRVAISNGCCFSLVVVVAELMGSELQCWKGCAGRVWRRQAGEVCAVTRWRWSLGTQTVVSACPAQRRKATSDATGTTHQGSCRCGQFARWRCLSTTLRPADVRSLFLVVWDVPALRAAPGRQTAHSAPPDTKTQPNRDGCTTP